MPGFDCGQCGRQCAMCRKAEAVSLDKQARGALLLYLVIIPAACAVLLVATLWALFLYA